MFGISIRLSNSEFQPKEVQQFLPNVRPSGRTHPLQKTKQNNNEDELPKNAG